MYDVVGVLITASVTFKVEQCAAQGDEHNLILQAEIAGHKQLQVKAGATQGQACLKPSEPGRVALGVLGSADQCLAAAYRRTSSGSGRVMHLCLGVTPAMTRMDS